MFYWKTDGRSNATSTKFMRPEGANKFVLRDCGEWPNPNGEREVGDGRRETQAREIGFFPTFNFWLLASSKRDCGKYRL